MHRKGQSFSSILLASTSLLLAACGGNQPPPDAAPGETATQPKPPASAPASPASAEAPPASANAAPAATSADAPASPAPEQPAPARHVVDWITGPNVAFTIDYANSEAKPAADRACAAKVGEDPAARAKCVEKERSKFYADVLSFSKDGNRFLLKIYKRDHNSLIEVSTSAIEFGPETDSGVTAKVTSDKGTRPLFVGKKEIPISAPPGSQIELDDPRFGRLVYDAKIGLVDKGQ
jgi:hypothetical protein